MTRQFGPEYYNGKYFESDKFGKKVFRRPDGSLDKWGYEARQRWNGWDYILPAVKILFNPSRLLDVGCGTGSLLEWTRKHKIKAFGFDFSRWGTRNHLAGAKGKIFCADARHIPVKTNFFDFVISTDLMEHIYLEDVDQVINELYRVSSRWVFLQIATVGPGDRPKEGYALEKGKPVPLEVEVYAVAGHVLVKKPEWWEKRLVRDGWVVRKDMEDKFRRLVRSDVVQYWRTIFVMYKRGEFNG